MNKTILILLLSLLGTPLICQTKKYYHTYRPSDSHIILTEWRVNYEDRGKYYIIETTDEKNRVIELRLMENDSLKSSDCYDESIIKFEYYSNDSIVQYNMINDSSFSTGIECGAPSKIVYILEDNVIEKSINYIFYDEYLNSNYELEPDFKDYLEKEKEKNKNGTESNASFIYGYILSSARYNGYLPVEKDFMISNLDYWLPYTDSLINSKFSILNATELYKINE